MQLSQVLTTFSLLLTLAAGLPANLTLDERGLVCHWAWVGSSDPTDTECKKVVEKDDNDRPKMWGGSSPSDCEKLHREGGRMAKIFWGECGRTMGTFSFFYDEKCTQYAKILQRDKGEGGYSCFDTRADKRPWKAVRVTKW